MAALFSDTCIVGPHIKYGELVDPAYCDMLAAIIDNHERLTRQKIADHLDVDVTTVTRTVSGRRPTIKAAVRIYNAMLDLEPHLVIPPPVLPITHQDDYRAARVMQRLRKADPAMFAEVLERLSGLLDAAEERAEARAELEKALPDSGIGEPG